MPQACPSRAAAFTTCIAFSGAVPLPRKLTNCLACCGVLQRTPTPTAASPFSGAGPSAASTSQQKSMAAAAAIQKNRIAASGSIFLYQNNVSASTRVHGHARDCATCFDAVAYFEFFRQIAAAPWATTNRNPVLQKAWHAVCSRQVPQSFYCARHVVYR